MKSARQQAILDIIEQSNIQTQEEMADALRAHGFAVTQATVSRDIKELRLIKIMFQKGMYKYATVEKAEKGMSDRFIRIFSESVLSVDGVGNLIVVKTLTGAGNAAGEALDAMGLPGVVGTIAGDNTLLIIARSEEAVGEITRRFKALIKA